MSFYLPSTLNLLDLPKSSPKLISAHSKSSLNPVLIPILFAYLGAIHPVFHVSQLESIEPNTIPNRSQEPPPPVEVEGEEHYEVSDILDSKINKQYQQILLRYFVWWLGYKGTDEEYSWVAADELIAEFHLQYPNKPGPLDKL